MHLQRHPTGRHLEVDGQPADTVEGACSLALEVHAVHVAQFAWKSLPSSTVSVDGVVDVGSVAAIAAEALWPTPPLTSRPIPMRAALPHWLRRPDFWRGFFDDMEGISPLSLDDVDDEEQDDPDDAQTKAPVVRHDDG